MGVCEAGADRVLIEVWGAVVVMGIWARAMAVNERLVAQRKRSVATRLIEMIVRRGRVC